jgi:FlaA1/EpsC-like NDP-sugar epimerase
MKPRAARTAVVLLAHAGLVAAAFMAAAVLHADSPAAVDLSFLLRALPWVLLVKLAALSSVGLFRASFRHAGLPDLLALTKGLAVGSAALVAAGPLLRLPLQLLVLDWMTSLLVIGGARFAIRSYREHLLAGPRNRSGVPTLVIGAGSAAARLIHSINNGDLPHVRPLGMVDDDPAKQQRRLLGLQVLGTTREIGSLASRHGIKLLIIAVPSASREQMQVLVDQCMRTGVEYRIVPSLREIMDGRSRVSQLRKVEAADLLGRDPVTLDSSVVELTVAGATVLVTGAAGSIGSELAHQIASFAPRRLILLDQAESPLYFVHLDILQAHPHVETVPIIADIADETRLDAIFTEHRPDLVFHAAAYKHVPLLESNAAEAVRNNVLGTLVVARCAVRADAARFVLISTDKAVYPSSVMGATKRVAERIVLGWPELRNGRTDFRAVRFGNVLGSDGSVIPLFHRQISAGRPVTVTHPDVTRYFMTIPEAVQLVLEAATLPEAAGRICVLEMGQPVRILDLAENVIRLSGLEPYRDVPIVFTGLRPGEKLHEELMSQRERTIPTSNMKVMVVDSREDGGQDLVTAIEALAAELATGSQHGLVDTLRGLVPECVPPLYHPRVVHKAPAIPAMNYANGRVHT